MQPNLTQPDAIPISRDLVAAILRHTVAADPPPTFSVIWHGQFSNDLAEVRLEDGRTLMVKRGRYDWARERFEAARLAGGLLQRHAALVAPESLLPPDDIDVRPIDVYWRIERPTLAELWPTLGSAARRAAMRSLGESLRRTHGIRLSGHGRLCVARERPGGLADALREDLEARLLPAARETWPGGVPVLERLVASIPDVERRTAGGGVLLHGDLHLGNVLCDARRGAPSCVGLLDLECAHAGPAESDLARLLVIQTELFEMPLEGEWVEWLLEGYAQPVDAALCAFYRLFHLAHLGCHSARLGHDDHAREVAAAAESQDGFTATTEGKRVARRNGVAPATRSRTDDGRSLPAMPSPFQAPPC